MSYNKESEQKMVNILKCVWIGNGNPVIVHGDNLIITEKVNICDNHSGGQMETGI